MSLVEPLHRFLSAAWWDDSSGKRKVLPINEFRESAAVSIQDHWVWISFFPKHMFRDTENKLSTEGAAVYTDSRKGQLYTPTPGGTSVIWQPSSNTHPSPAPAHFPVSTFSFLPTLTVGLMQRTMTILQMLHEGRSAHDGMMVASETLCENGPQGFIFKLLPLEHLS